MNSSIITRYLIVLVACIAPGLSIADDPAAVKTLAGILSQLNHYPSAEEKAVLMDIQNDASNSEAVKTIARAMHDMQHAVAAADKARLDEITTSDASGQVKELADILSGVNHAPDTEAKARLDALK